MFRLQFNDVERGKNGLRVSAHARACACVCLCACAGVCERAWVCGCVCVCVHVFVCVRASVCECVGCVVLGAVDRPMRIVASRACAGSGGRVRWRLEWVALAWTGALQCRRASHGTT